MSLLIKNATVVDGTGNAPYRADILSQSGRILAVGGIADYRADESLDAAGMFAVPGFIDLVSYADVVSSPFADCRQEDYLKQGVTTVVIGHSGHSLAPIFGRHTEYNRDWGLWSDFIRSAGRSRFGVRFLSFVGSRNLFHNDERVSLSLLDDSLSHGALGVSFGWSNQYSGLNGGLVHLAESAARRGRLLSATLPLNLTVKERQRALLDLLRAKRRGEYDTVSGRRVASSRLVVSGVDKSDINYLKRSRSLHEVIIGYNPYDLRLVGVSSLLPSSLRPAFSDGSLWRSAAASDRLQKHFRRFNPDSVFILSSSHPFFQKETLSSFASRLCLPPAAALVQIAKNYPHALLAFNTRVSPDWSPLKERQVFLSAIVAKGARRPFREFIGLGLKGSSWTLPNVVSRLSAAPAAALGLGGDRGIISPGRRADIVLIGKEGDISSVIVGGEISFSPYRHQTVTGTIEPYVYL